MINNTVSPFTSKSSVSPFQKKTPAVSPFGLGKKPQASGGMSVYDPKTAYTPPATPAPVSTGVVAPPAPSKVNAGSVGMYKGTAITPGTQPEIQSQIARIDAAGMPKRGLLDPKNTPFASTLSQTLPTPPKPTFSGYVEKLDRVAEPSGDQKLLLKKIEDEARKNARIGENAAKLSEQYGERIAEVGRLGAGAVAGNLTTGTDVVGSGNAAIASQSASQRMSALSQAQQAALAGTGQQLTAQGQVVSGLESALGGANTQQQLQIGGTGTAAGLAAPSGNYPFTFDPLTGGFGQAGNGTILNPQQAAMDVMSGKLGYDQAKQALSYLGGTGEAQLQAAITAAGGNPLQLQAQGQATQQNIGTSATTPTNTAAAGYQEAVQTYNNLSVANNQADLQAEQVISVLDRTGLNSSNLRDYNKAINSLSNRIGSENVAALNTAMTELQNFYSQILSVGGITPTGSENAAINTLNPNSSAKQIRASIAELQRAAYNRLTSNYDLISQYQQNLQQGGGFGGAPQGGSSGGGLYSF